MNPRHLLTLLFFSAIYLLSCKKDSSDTPANTNITGSYKFISLAASTTSTQTVSDGVTVDKSITYSDYVTKNNTGTLTIDDKNMVSTDLSYTVDTTAKAYFYEDGVLIDSVESDFYADIPKSSATCGYQMITSDSVYVTNGSMFFNGSTSSTTPAGARIKVEGDKLYFFSSGTKTETQNQGGVSIIQEAKASIIATYQKQ
jgi:hypothetical protein